MADQVSTLDVRARIGDLLNRVALRHDEFIIERSVIQKLASTCGPASTRELWFEDIVVLSHHREPEGIPGVSPCLPMT
jgi:hypothetical protein